MKREKIIDKLKKIQALAEKGSDGEKTEAARQLQELCLKYGISLEEIHSEKREEYFLRYKGQWQGRLMAQIAASMDLKVYNAINPQTGRHINKKCIVATPLEIAEVKEAIRHYNAQYEDELESLFVAFVHRHSLLAKPGNPNGRSISEEELAKLQKMMRGLSSTSFIPEGHRLEC